MKERATTVSADPYSHPLLPSYNSLEQHQHHDHRLNSKAGADDDRGVWRELRDRGAADFNLLTNSLTSRLRKAARHRASSGPPPGSGSAPSRSTATTTAEEATGEEATGEGDGRGSRGRSGGKKPTSYSYNKHRPSILKRSLSREEAERNQRFLQDQYSPRSTASNDSGYRLPGLYRRFSGDCANGGGDDAKPKQRDHAGIFAGGGGGGGGGGFHSIQSSQMWVKRAGIFQPADKYAQGRQNLYAHDQPFSHHHPVDYETVTIRSQSDSPDSDSGSTSGWSSGKSLRRKGLKVSWKKPEEGENGGEAGDRAGAASATENAMSASSSPVRMRSAGTAQSDIAYSHKPVFVPGRSRVPVIGLRWKVSVPAVTGARVPGGWGADGAQSPNPSESSRLSSPNPSHSPLPKALHTGLNLQQNGSHSTGSKSSQPSSRVSRSWRALHPRDVHPVTTAMEREGTSVSKTKWHVPNTRKVPPAFILIEDLLDSRIQQWNPVAIHNHTRAVLQGRKEGKFTTRPTLDGQSLQNRMVEAGQDYGGGNNPSPSVNTTSNTTAGESIADDDDATLTGGGEEDMDCQAHWPQRS